MRIFLVLAVLVVLAGCKNNEYHQYTMTCLENGEYVERVFTENEDKVVIAWANEGNAGVTVKMRGRMTELETFRWAYEHQCRLHSKYLKNREVD